MFVEDFDAFFPDIFEIDLLWLKLRQDFEQKPEHPSSPAACCCPSDSPQTGFRDGYRCCLRPQVDDHGHAAGDGAPFPEVPTLASTRVSQIQPQCFSINTVIQADRRSSRARATKWLHEDKPYLLLREEENHQRS